MPYSLAANIPSKRLIDVTVCFDKTENDVTDNTQWQRFCFSPGPFKFAVGPDKPFGSVFCCLLVYLDVEPCKQQKRLK